MPLPADPKVIFLGGIFFILLLAALYITAEIVWPLVFAFALSLLLNPLLRFLASLHVPRVLGALILVAAVLALVVALGTAISGPAASWAAKLPDGLPRLFEHLRFLEAPLAALQHFWQQIRDFAGWQNEAGSSPGSAFLTKLLTGTRSFADGFFTTLLFLFFSSCRRRDFSTAPRRNHAPLQRQASGGRYRPPDRERYFSLSPDHYSDECRRRNRHCGGHVAYRGGRSCIVGDGSLSAKFRANPRPVGGCSNFPARRCTCRRIGVADASPGRTLPRHPLGRGGDNYADVACSALHAQPGPGDCVSGFLVLDVGRSWRDTIRANTGNNEDRLRSCAAFGGVRPLLGRLKLSRMQASANLGSCCWQDGAKEAIRYTQSFPPARTPGKAGTSPKRLPRVALNVRKALPGRWHRRISDGPRCPLSKPTRALLKSRLGSDIGRLKCRS
jgi:AI-2E family transporter